MVKMCDYEKCKFDRRELERKEALEMALKHKNKVGVVLPEEL